MNVRTKPTGDEGAVSPAAVAASEAIDAPAQSAAPAAGAAAQHKPEKAVSEPDRAPAIPRDDFHGKGGRYALVDGKRVPIDEDGKPLPVSK